MNINIEDDHICISCEDIKYLKKAKSTSNNTNNSNRVIGNDDDYMEILIRKDGFTISRGYKLRSSYKDDKIYDELVSEIKDKIKKKNIYIGRLPNGKFNKWAYPKELREKFPEGTSRKEIIQAYEDYLLSNDELMNSLCELKDKTLGCWCKDKGGKTGKSCHGDILVKWVKKLCN